MNRTAILSMFIACMSLQAIAQTGSITNILVNQRTDGSGLLDVYFDLSGEFENYHIFLEASFDNGLTYLFLDPAFLQGDTGPLPSGTQYHIVWDGYASFPDIYSEEAKLKIIAERIIGNWIPCPDLPYFVDDRDSTIYNTVLIGDQCWMKENLNYYVDNSFCYDDDDAMCDVYGRLYTWDAAMAGSSSSNNVPSGVQGVCPTGWHLPSDAEWQIMVDYLMDEYDLPNENYLVNSLGNALKSCRQINSPLGGVCDTYEHPRWEDGYNSGWEDDVTHFGTDDFGFSGLPGGFTFHGNSYHDLGFFARWWSSTESAHNPEHVALGRGMTHYYGHFYQTSGGKSHGRTIRCIRD